jgi:hypothetical protein
MKWREKIPRGLCQQGKANVPAESADLENGGLDRSAPLQGAA